MAVNRVQNLITAALNEQALECYDALCGVMSEKLVAPIGKISESVSNSFFEGVVSAPKQVNEAYDSLDPQVQRAVDYVVEGVAANGIGAFEALVESVEERFAIYDDSVKNYFIESVSEDHSPDQERRVEKAQARKNMNDLLNHLQDTNKTVGSRIKHNKAFLRKKKKSVSEDSYISAVKDHIGGKTEKQKDKEAVDAVFGPRRKKTAAQRRAGKKFISRKY